MLKRGKPRVIAIGSRLGSMDGQVIVFFVMNGRGGRICDRPRIIISTFRNRGDRPRRRLLTLNEMVTGHQNDTWFSSTRADSFYFPLRRRVQPVPWRQMGRARGQRRRPGVMFAAFARRDLGILKLLAMRRQRASPSICGDGSRRPIHAELGLRVDALSGVMVMIVTGVGALIHLYSVGYMAHDEDFGALLYYMNLFALSMLILILADNLLIDVRRGGKASDCVATC